MENISIEVIFVLIVMLVSAIKWFVENFGSKNKTLPRDEEEGPINTLEDLYEEARREILERQGRMSPEGEEEIRESWPDREVEPPPVQPTLVQPTPAPTRTVPPPLPEEPPPVTPQFRKPEKPKLSQAEQEALKRMQERQAAGRRKRRPAPAHGNLRRLLATPHATRQAIVLREVLGPPKAARELQDHLA